jgi:hypothetical protein
VPTPTQNAEDPTPYARKLTSYNQSVERAAVTGKIELKDRGLFPFGARSVRGEGARLDAVSGMLGKLVLQLACRADQSCSLYLPDRRTAYQSGDWATATWITELLLGRVALDGQPESGWTDESGVYVVRYVRPATGWVTVVMDESGRLPARVYYTDGEGDLMAHVRYGQFAQTAKRWFPGKIELYGSGDEPQLTLTLKSVDTEADISSEIFSPPLPPATRVVTEGADVLGKIAPILNALP